MLKNRVVDENQFCADMVCVRVCVCALLGMWYEVKKSFPIHGTKMSHVFYVDGYFQEKNNKEAIFYALDESYFYVTLQ